MATLVTLGELKAYLGESSTTYDEVLTEILDNVEALLEEEVSRTFSASQTGITDEPHNGTGTDEFKADFPVSSLTSVKIGIDPNDPDKTLDTVPDDIDFDGRVILRRDGGWWPRGRKNLYLTYDAAAYLPTVARQAVMEGAAYLFRRRGKEHAASTTVGEFGSTQYAALFSKLPAWSRAVRALRGPVMA